MYCSVVVTLIFCDNDDVKAGNTDLPPTNTSVISFIEELILWDSAFVAEIANVSIGVAVTLILFKVLDTNAGIEPVPLETIVPINEIDADIKLPTEPLAAFEPLYCAIEVTLIAFAWE